MGWRWKCISKEQNEESKNRPTHMWTTDLQQSYKGNLVDKKWSFQQMVLGEVDIHMHKHKLWSIYSTIYKTQLKIHHKPKYKSKNCKIVPENTRESPCDTRLGKNFIDDKSIPQSVNEQINKLYFQKGKNFCSSKDTTERMKRQANDWESVWKSYNC